MNAAELHAAAIKLGAALEASGLRIQKGVTRGGNLVDRVDVSPHELLGCWLSRKYAIRNERATPPETRPTPGTRILRLHVSPGCQESS